MIRIKVALKKGRNFGEFLRLVQNIDGWCKENLQDDEWDILDGNFKSVKKDRVLMFYTYYEFKDPAIATLMSVKFGL